MTQPPPLPNCYWLPGARILAGEYPGASDAREAARKLRLLQAAGVDTFIDLTEAEELEPYESLAGTLVHPERGAPAYFRLPVRDLDVPSPAQMHRILGAGRVGAGAWTYRVRSLPGRCRKDRYGRWLLPRAPGLERAGGLAADSRVVEGNGETASGAAVARDGCSTRFRPRMGGARGRSRKGPLVVSNRRCTDFYRGCLLGGAVGDGLGAPVEFMSMRAIHGEYGPRGIREFAPAYGRVGAITDDTQMTLFTAEGLLRAKVRAEQKGMCSIADVVYHAYLRWLRTQGESLPTELEPLDGWLFKVRGLHDRRAPGNTCLGALAAGQPGSRDEPRNNSKGCGGVMRMAPAGLVQDADSFQLGCDLAAITHGHPSGYLAAGAFAAIVRAIIEGSDLLDGVEAALGRLSSCRGHEECTGALRRAVEAWHAGAPSAERVASLGEGWVAEEALAIGAYCALAAGSDFELGARLAVNHGGDSDSTGAIAGNLLGARLGVEAIPPRWLARLELRPEIEQLADDLLTWFRPDDAWRDRYPGW